MPLLAPLSPWQPQQNRRPHCHNLLPQWKRRKTSTTGTPSAPLVICLFKSVHVNNSDMTISLHVTVEGVSMAMAATGHTLCHIAVKHTGHEPGPSQYQIIRWYRMIPWYHRMILWYDRWCRVIQIRTLNFWCHHPGRDFNTNWKSKHGEVGTNDLHITGLPSKPLGHHYHPNSRRHAPRNRPHQRDTSRVTPPTVRRSPWRLLAHYNLCWGHFFLSRLAPRQPPLRGALY